ncbi:helix-turn-helix domain-containing protein [Paenibacillus sp. M1]|uniref:Helix-turn-helix domain-containing protein n=1 Tax=Paenibacillus haidiansis TaxID=1574488 RepID=A0ABU7VR06_9BACL
MAGLSPAGGFVDGPLIHVTSLLENYIEVRLEEDSEYAGSFIAGPSLYGSVPEKIINGIGEDMKRTDKAALQRYYDNLTIIPQKRLLHAAALLYYLVYGKRLDITQIRLANGSVETPFRISDQIDIEVSDRLNNDSLHHDRVYEMRLMELIKEGRDVEVARELSIGFATEGVGTLSKRSHLRHLKNLAIAGISIATRAAMDGGVHPEIAYTMSDLYIQQIEEMHKPKEVDKAMKQALIEFASRVKEGIEDHVSGSGAVSTCKRYIFNHLYGELSLETLSGLVHMNSSYLSRLFKKETGMSLTDYIQSKRVDEAKKLLALTSLSLSDIYSRLHFNDQSYFIKVFKKWAGMTPRQYRNDIKK